MVTWLFTVAHLTSTPNSVGVTGIAFDGRGQGEERVRIKLSLEVFERVTVGTTAIDLSPDLGSTG